MKNLYGGVVFFSHLTQAVFTWDAAIDEWQRTDLFTKNAQMFLKIDVIVKEFAFWMVNSFLNAKVLRKNTLWLSWDLKKQFLFPVKESG